LKLWWFFLFAINKTMNIRILVFHLGLKVLMYFTYFSYVLNIFIFQCLFCALNCRFLLQHCFIWLEFNILSPYNARFFNYYRTLYRQKSRLNFSRNSFFSGYFYHTEKSQKKDLKSTRSALFASEREIYICLIYFMIEINLTFLRRNYFWNNRF